VTTPNEKDLEKATILVTAWDHLLPKDYKEALEDVAQALSQARQEEREAVLSKVKDFLGKDRADQLREML